MSAERNPEYLGDGVYASFDGWYIWLRTGAHEGANVTNKIALEPSVYEALVRYQARLVKLARDRHEVAEVRSPVGVEPAESAARKLWSYEGYWNVVLGSDRNADDVVHDFDLVAEGLDEWLGVAEAEAWNQVGGKQALPEEWRGFHTRTLADLTSAAEAAAALAPESNDEAAASADTEHDKARDDRLTGDR
jgi:hypothetical protein